ncbi:MAG TPA: winged helix DNA-binding domain-containing protein [Candidatus Lumbricidophila sp.]|nr:winged helix DNA-binding domain-containing protein [Candidatus Lumbricidophila sp.]
MDLSAIARLRTHAQALTSGSRLTGAAAPVAAARHLVAMQTQDYRGGLWSIGARTDSATEREVVAALADARLVRTWPMRGTIHTVAADDVRWLTALLGPRASHAASGRRRGLGLGDAEVTTAIVTWERELAGRRALQRGPLFAALDAAGVDSGNQRGPHLLRHLAEQGMLCFGPNDGNQPTYVLLDEWVPASPARPREAALAELALRYFTSHGPATVDDLARWAHLTKSDVRAGLSHAASDLAELRVDGTSYWCSPEIAAADPTTAHETMLLAGFDELLLGYRDRRATAAPEVEAAIVPGGNGVFKPTVVHDGRVLGSWSLTRRARSQTAEINWLADAPRPTSADLEAAVGRYAAFAEKYTTWTTASPLVAARQ